LEYLNTVDKIILILGNFMDIYTCLLIFAVILIAFRRDRYAGKCKRHNLDLILEAGPECGYWYCPKCEKP